MKVFCHNHEPEWIVGRITEEFCKNTNYVVVDNMNDCDTIFLVAPWCIDQYLTSALQQKKVIVFYHHAVPEKFDKDKFYYFDKVIDCYIVPNKITEAFVKQHTNKRVEKINYWINPGLWQNTNRDETRKKLNLENKFVVFSAVRDTEGQDCDGNNPLPKIEKNPEGFVQAVKLIKKNVSDVHVLLGGWRRQFVMKRLKEENIYFTYVERPEIEVINKLYDAADLVVSPSLFEGGPQCVIEAGYKKVPTISTDCGLASEILHSNCVFDVTKKFYLPTIKDILYAHENVINKCDIYKQINKIDKLIESII